MALTKYKGMGYEAREVRRSQGSDELINNGIQENGKNTRTYQEGVSINIAVQVLRK